LFIPILSLEDTITNNNRQPTLNFIMDNTNASVTDSNMDFDASQLASVSYVKNIPNLLTV
jgi:hypothetical protein